MEQNQVLTPPQVRCQYHDLGNPQQLQPHPLNPNVHPPAQIELYLAIVQFQGVRLPVRVSRRSGFITKGHGLLLTYLHAGWGSIPIEYQDYDSEEQELADLAADNMLPKMSEMNTSKLQEIGVKLDTGAFNMTLMGIPENKLEKLMTVAPPPPTLSGQDGTPLVEGDAPAGSEGPTPSGDQPTPSHVRMIQLFLDEKSIVEFMHMAEVIQSKIKTESVTDTVLEVLRAAYRSYQQPEAEDTATDTLEEASPDGDSSEILGQEA